MQTLNDRKNPLTCHIIMLHWKGPALRGIEIRISKSSREQKPPASGHLDLLMQCPIDQRHGLRKNRRPLFSIVQRSHFLTRDMSPYGCGINSRVRRRERKANERAL